LELLSDDDRLRFQYSFIKAHTHRWAGRGVQLQNLKAARTKEEKAMIAAVIKMLETGRPVPDLDALSWPSGRFDRSRRQEDCPC
jgi:hypothetical protein